MPNQVERSINHHYVPQWYQKNFIKQGSHSLWVRDLEPSYVSTPNGKKNINEFENKGPKKFFKEEYLYTISDPDSPDIIEREMFGNIDRIASNAVAAIIENDIDAIITNFRVFLTFLTVFRYRTPKGIDLIRTIIGVFEQDAIMSFIIREKQDLNAMIGECFFEIVKSDNERNFIFSDHPFVLYNPKCYPGSTYCKYPFDPLFEYIGTQGYLPLSPYYCMIFTHRDWARNQGSGDGLAKRINARRNGATLVDLSKIIRTRNLAQNEVDIINYLTKTRSKKYIGAQNKYELYPEEQLRSRSWEKFGKVLIPNKSDIVRYGKNVEYMVGNGSKLLWAQDEYGRKQYISGKGYTP